MKNDKLLPKYDACLSVPLRLPREIVNKIDEYRAGIPRTKFLAEVIEDYVREREENL